MGEQGHLGNPAAQEKLRNQERVAGWVDDADVEWLLQHEEGRRIAYRLVYVICRLKEYSFDPGIKDGLCLALHQTRNEGIREVGAILETQFRRVSRDLWQQATYERWAADDREGERRQEAESTPPPDGE